MNFSLIPMLIIIYTDIRSLEFVENEVNWELNHRFHFEHSFLDSFSTSISEHMELLGYVLCPASMKHVKIGEKYHQSLRI